MPYTSATEFLLLQELGTGIEGRAWLACTPDTGLICVIKIFHANNNNNNDDDDALLEGTLREEANIKLNKQQQLWNSLWNLKTFSFHLTKLNTAAFVMPYILTANKLRLTLTLGKLTQPLCHAAEEALTKGG